jgi:hypothetical protein
VLSCQKEDGLFSFQVPEAAFVQRGSSQTASYNHAIAGLMLTEVYGQVAGPRAQQVKAAIARALLFTRQLQARPKAEVDKGGWRYLRLVTTTDSDISATAWQLMFLRSAKNAEFDVPPEPIQQAMAYVNRCWDPQSRMFNYGFENGAGYGASRGVTGAGIVCLAMGGQHQTPAALGAGDWLLAHPFQSAGEVIGTYDKFIYATYYCSQAAAQLGGRYWQGIYPPLVEALVNSQAPDGSWKPAADLAEFGEGLTTSMAVLSLTPAFQLLPVYQR